MSLRWPHSRTKRIPQSHRRRTKVGTFRNKELCSDRVHEPKKCVAATFSFTRMFQNTGAPKTRSTNEQLSFSSFTPSIIANTRHAWRAVRAMQTEINLNSDSCHSGSKKCKWHYVGACGGVWRSLLVWCLESGGWFRVWQEYASVAVKTFSYLI
jgi:hypothetical protein